MFARSASTKQKHSLFKHIKEGNIEAILKFINDDKNNLKEALESFNKNNETALHAAARKFLDSDQHMQILSILLHAAKDASFDFVIYPTIQGKKKLVDDVLNESLQQRRHHNNSLLRLFTFQIYVESITTELKDCTKQAMEKLVAEYEQRTINAVNMIESLFLFHLDKNELTRDLNEILEFIQTANEYSLPPMKKIDIYKNKVSQKNKVSDHDVSVETKQLYAAIIHFVAEDEGTLIALDNAIRKFGNNYQPAMPRNSGLTFSN